MIKLTTNFHTVIAPIVAQLSTPELADRITRIVAVEMLGEMRARIHQQGKAADGSDIGAYSTKPLYVSIKQNVGKSFGAPLGKPNKYGKRSSKFASGAKAGQSHSSRYFERGYEGYKNAIGRNTIGKVNLSLSGQLDAQLTLMQTPIGWGLGWADAEKFKRANALQDKKYRKKIWALTDEEAEKAVTTAEREVANAFS